MHKIMNRLTVAAAICVMTMTFGTAQAQVVVSTFDTFFENALYASWAAPEAIINSGPESYSVTATGYGSNWTYIEGTVEPAAGSTHLELDIALSGPAEADGFLGPIITLVDADNTRHSYAWYGQTLGDHLLTMPVTSPTIMASPGTVPGLDLDALVHMHMELDPGEYGTSGAYTVEWKNLNLITVEGQPGDFDGDADVDGSDLIFWQRDTGLGDLSDWQENYGTFPQAAALAGVPEPGSLSLVLLVLPATFGIRRPLRK